MSVLENLKGRLQNVQQDISSGWRNLTGKEIAAGKVRLRSQSGDSINLDAGADLLNKFQDTWMDIHKRTKNNSKAAQGVDSQVSYLYLACEHQNDMINALHQELAGLPKLLEDIQGITNLLATLEETFDAVESSVFSLEDMIEEAELKRKKVHHHCQLALYKERKDVELEQIKVQLALDHANMVKAFEKKHQHNLRDRQEAFQEAFSEDMQNYKLFGKAERPPSVDSSNQPDLGDIKIDDDPQDLDAFLQSDEVTSDSTPENTPEHIPNTDQVPNGADTEKEETDAPVEVKTDQDISVEDEIPPVGTVAIYNNTGTDSKDSESDTGNLTDPVQPVKNKNLPS